MDDKEVVIKRKQERRSIEEIINCNASSQDNHFSLGGDVDNCGK